MLLFEHKSRGKDLDRAYTQALDYFPGINERDLPRYIIVSDFARIRLHDTFEAFGQYFMRLPLKKAPNIVHGNALRLDWASIAPPESLSYIVGNPPFIAK